MSNTCIRVLADPVQIKECRESISRIDTSLNEMAKVYNLAGSAVRLKILYLLNKEDEMCPCDLSDVLDISVGGISQHLRKLKDAGMVKDKKVGQTIFYSLVEGRSAVLMPTLENLLQENNNQLTI
ncbi:MAG TPA: metalloregulator ArsR/SmtB family transcription factor [Fulvivirga sp.]|nr:metalloregulator ArsR/SmtB family transcription factor [Fulvivirga sp.]